MKKYLLVNAAVLFTAAFTWAQEAKFTEPNVTIKADATAAWGIDFGQNGFGADKIKHGFKNSNSWEVKFDIIKKTDKNSAENKKDSDVYGEIILKDVQFQIVSEHDKNSGKFYNHKDAKVDSMEAKLWFYKFYLQVYNKPEFKTDFANMDNPLIKTSKYDKDRRYYEPQFGQDNGSGGIAFGYKNDELKGLHAAVKFGSNGNWTSGRHGRYGMGIDFEMKPLEKDMLDFNVSLNSTFSGSHHYGLEHHRRHTSVAINGGAQVTSKPVEGLELKLAFDGGSDPSESTNSFGWDTEFKTTYKWITGALYAASEGTAYQSTKKDGSKGANLGVMLGFETKDDEKTASFITKGLEAGASIRVYDLLCSYNDKSIYPIIVNAHASYEIPIGDAMSIKPFGNFWGETNHFENPANKNSKNHFGIAYNLGVTYMPVEKVEVTAKWQQGATQKEEPLMLKKIAFGPNNHNGEFTLGVKITY